MQRSQPKAKEGHPKAQSLKFESINLDSIFPTLDAIAWLDLPDIKQISQFAGIDPRTTGKILKNCILIGVIQSVNESSFSLNCPYPYKGTADQKRSVIKESLVRLPLMIYLRQFLNFGDNIDSALRKSATVVGITNFDPTALSPLLKWAKTYNVLRPEVMVEDLIEEASVIKEQRHREHKKDIVTFISHSSKDKPFIRQLTSDMTKDGIYVWLDEQRILVGDSISDKISQGLVESDYFLVVLSEASVNSAWVQKELNSALIDEIERKKVKILPIKLSECTIPPLIKDKKYADFTKSYKEGYSNLLDAINKR